MGNWVELVLEPVEQYLRTFSWNKVKYRADKSLGELIDLLGKVGAMFSLCVVKSLANVVLNDRKQLVLTMIFGRNTPNTIK